MASFKIQGCAELKGEIFPQGAKNEVLQTINAALLTPEKVIIHNIPNIRDVNQLIDLHRNLGVEVIQLGKNSYSFQAKEIDIDFLQTAQFRQQARLCAVQF